MKKIILNELVATILFACKKNSSGDGASKIVMSKVFENGKLQYEYAHNSDGQVTTSAWYKEEMGAVVPGGTEKFFYNEKGSLKESISYSLPSNTVSTTSKYKVDATGRVTRVSYYNGDGSAPGDLYLHVDYEYTKTGKIKKQTWSDSDDDITSFREFDYYENGNMKAIDAYKVSGLSQEKFYSLRFDAADATPPVALVRPFAMPVNYYIDYMVTGKVESFSYEDDALDNHTEMHMSERQFDGRGFVIKQKLTTKHILPGGSDEMRTLEFEWKKL